MRNTILVGLVTLIILLSSPAWAKLNVVATIPDLASIAAEVGGPQVSVHALTTATQDPHFVDARPNFLVPLSRADLLIVNGLSLEVGWLPTLLVGARNAHIQPGANGYFDASTAIRTKLEVNRVVDRAAGDVHVGGNPHYTHDPRNAAAVALALAAQFARLDPEHTKDYQARAQSFAAKLEAFAAKARARLAIIPAAQRQLVTYHRSWAYLLAWLNLKVIIEVEPRPGIAPTPAHVARVVKAMRVVDIKLMLQETYYPRKTPEVIARMTGAKMQVTPGQTHYPTQDYLDRMRTLVDQIEAGLKGAAP